MIRKFCFLIWIISSHFVDGQVVQTARIDIPVKWDIQSYSAMPLGVSGLMLYRNFIAQPTNVLEVVRYDTSLQQRWEKILPVPRGFFSIKSKVSNGNAYFLFAARLPENHDYHVIVVDTTDGYALSYPIKNEIKFNATDFAVSKEAILIGGYMDYRPVVLHYSLTDKRLTVLPGLTNQLGEIAQLVMYPDGESDVVISGENSLLQKWLWIVHYNNAGALTKSTLLTPDEGKNLIFGKTVKNNNNKQLAVGVYSYDLQHPQGIFTSVIDTSAKNVIRYYNFDELKRFFNDRKPEREKHLKALYKEKELTGEKTNFRHRYIVQDILPVGNKFVMIAEAFYPNQLRTSYYYRNVLQRDYGNKEGQKARSYIEINTLQPWTYGLPKRLFESGEFASFYYTRALVIGLSDSGELEWDNNILTQDMESHALEEKIQFLPEQGALLYLFDNTINYKKIKADSTLTPIIQQPIKTFDGQEIVEYNANNKLMHWYKNNFFVFGTETLHRHTVELEVHKVFFINKLRAH